MTDTPRTTNAAYRLAALLRQWQVPHGSTPEKVRGFRNKDDLDAWRSHAQAADLIRTVDNTLQGLNAMGENVDMFQAALPRWYAGVHFAATPWSSKATSNVPRSACAAGDINLLEALGLVLRAGNPVSLDEDDRRRLSDVLAEARALIESDGLDLPTDVRAYLWSLILRAEAIVRSLGDFSTEEVRQVAIELGGALIVRGEQTEAQDPARAGRLKSLGLMLVGGFLARGGEAGANALGRVVGEGFKQLGGS